jgi:muramoyltetrapeptide carboxypeptidase
MKIGVVAASSRFDRATADRVTALVAAHRPDVGLVFHPNSFLEAGHFAGDDAARAEAVLDIANDPALDALWFARGGYGSCRIAQRVADGLAPCAAAKAYMGYSDAGSLLAMLYARGFSHIAHGPMPADINRPGGEAAVLRGLDWLVDRATAAVEPSVGEAPVVAFNLTILGALMGTPLAPDLTDHVVMLEEVSEAHYRIDRALFHLMNQPAMQTIKGVRLGRVSDIPPNDPDFGATPEQIVRDWCDRTGVAFLGAADIGHDIDNRVVPFGPPG